MLPVGLGEVAVDKGKKKPPQVRISGRKFVFWRAASAEKMNPLSFLLPAYQPVEERSLEVEFVRPER